MLEIKNLTKVYYPKHGLPVRALDGVDVTFEETGMVFVLGKSGSGKSTFLNLVGGLDSITEGEVVIKGRSSIDFSQGDFDSYRNTFIGFIFQEYNILNEFTVGKNIALALELQGKKAGVDEVNDILDQVDLTGYANRKPNELSGGQKQRVAIARALIKDPEIIMADEPTGALDSNTGKQVFETLQKLSKTKLVIIVSHDRDYAEFYGDRVIEFADGKIISDIKKYTAQSHAVSDGLSVVDGSIIHIKPGYTLTDKDKQTVLSFLNKSDQEIILSRDGKSNTDFRRLARIDHEGNKESFTVTDEKSQQIKDYDPSDLKLVRSRLPVRSSTKIALSSLKVKPFRLFLTILLSAISFGLFGLADTLGAYDKVTVTYNSLVESNINFIAYAKEVEFVDEEYGYTWHSTANLSDADAKRIQVSFPDQTFDKLYKSNFHQNPSNYINSNLQPSRFHQGGWGSSALQSVIGVNTAESDFYSKRGLTLVGRNPSSSDEIVIPEFVYYTFRDYGYSMNRQGGSGTNVSYTSGELSTPQSFVNKNIMFGDKTVVGVVLTGFNEHRYEELKTEGEGGILDTLLVYELSGAIQNSYHGALFVNAQHLGNYVDGLGGSTSVIPGMVKLGDSYIRDTGNSDIYPEYAIPYSSMSGRAMFTQAGKTSVNEDEFLLSSEAIGNIYYRMNHLIDSRLESIIREDINAKIGTIRAQLPAVLSSNSYLADIWRSHVLGGSYSGNATDFDTSKITVDACYRFIVRLIDHNDTQYDSILPTGLRISDYSRNGIYNASYILRSLPDNAFSLEFYSAMKHDYKVKTMRLVGYYETSGFENSNSLNNGIVLNDAVLTDFMAGEAGNISTLITPLTGNRAQDIEMIKFSYEPVLVNDQIVYYPLRNAVSNILSDLNETAEILGQVFLYVGLAFAVFAALLLSNFIAISISYKKREIGILRAIGARSSDVFKIFFTESLFIALISFLFGAVGSGIGAFALNSLFRNELGLLITVLTFSIRQIALILGVALLVAFIASFLPVYRTARKKPIEAIRTA